MELDNLELDIEDTVSTNVESIEDTSSVFNASQSPSQRKKYFESGGEIGYLKGQTFFPLTNFSVKCTGYVASKANATCADGFLLDVIQKVSVRVSENDEWTENTRKK